MPGEESFDITQLTTPALRKERVSLTAGPLWVWEMTVAESVQIIDHATRPAIDPRGGLDRAESAVWQIMLSCYNSDQPGAERVFKDADLLSIYRLRLEEFGKLMAAINRVNGNTSTEEDLQRDFTAVTAGKARSRS